MYKNHDQLIDVITIFCGQSLFEGYGVPWMEVKSGFRDPKKVPLSLDRGVPLIETTNTKIIWTFLRDQILCPLNVGVPWKAVPQKRGYTVHRFVK